MDVITKTKACVCGHSLAGVAGSNSAWGLECLCFVSAVWCQVETYAAVLITRPEASCRVRCVVSKPQQLGCIDPLGFQAINNNLDANYI